jgi:hypothetical protein
VEVVVDGAGADVVVVVDGGIPSRPCMTMSL